MKKTALKLTLMSALLFSVVGIELVNVAEANPFFTFKNVDPIPGAIPPPIAIYSPQNNTVHFSDNITISFSISEFQLDEWFSSIISVEYSLDGRNVELFDMWDQDGGPLSEFKTNFSISSLSIGNHRLRVKAGCVFRRFSHITSDGRSYMGEIFGIDSVSTILFTIGDSQSSTTTPAFSPEPTHTPEPSSVALPTVTPTPTLTPSPSSTPTFAPEPTPTLTPLEEVDVQNTSQYLVTAGTTAFTVTVVLVGLGLLVYLIKRK